ncbi:hypothetical protein M758_1G171600 [Ceratodon purpureus]|uniref:Uncharacterized protein n=1 Tax=Ceratodon purpureus TaxID=3225 RepID=A0A8T0J9K1_CERPU|nr:hypothetical protein KC19_1G174900 [Ceratodon purpureus]KAG0630339.1 hypothetical protein M758_1G171600 [Ceratodon purpureus]
MEGSRDGISCDDGGDIVEVSDEMGTRSRGFSGRGERMASSGEQYHLQAQYVAPQQGPRRWHSRVVQRLERWIFLYNVTTGLYMLDWWERCIFNAVFIIFFAVAGYNSGHYLQRIGAGLLAWAWCGDSARAQEGLLGDGAGGAGG